ncbi:MAG: 3-oxoacyl-ACP reductase FabG [Pseudomonadota bacterium]
MAPSDSEPRIALVTGATRGIGAAIASHLVELGHTVVGTATSEAGAVQISERLGGEKNLGKVLQLHDADSIDQTIAEITQTVGVPTILVNNAGVTRDNLLLRMQPDEWSDVIETNLNGVFRVTKGCVRGMIKARWGRIVNIGSVVGRMGNPGQSNYVASKAAIEGFSRSLAMEVASRNITVNTVAPGFIGTDMTDKLTEEQTDAMLARIPMGRVGRVNEVAECVGYLVSDGAGYLTAQTMHINGGLYAA